MLTTTRLTGTLLTAAVALTALTGPAHADPYPIQASSSPGVLFETCVEHPISYAVDPPDNAFTWSIDFTLQAPDGTGAGSDTVTTSDPEAGVTTVQMCGSDLLPGTYTVTGTYRVLVGATMNLTPVTPFTFDMRMPLSSVDAKPSDTRPRRGEVVKVKVKATDERPSGELFGTPSASVLLQRQVDGRWVKVRGAKGYTGRTGSTQIRFRNSWKGKNRFRVFANLGYPGKAASAPFTLRTRR